MLVHTFGLSARVERYFDIMDSGLVLRRLKPAKFVMKFWNEEFTYYVLIMRSSRICVCFWICDRIVVQFLMFVIS